MAPRCLSERDDVGLNQAVRGKRNVADALVENEKFAERIDAVGAEEGVRCVDRCCRGDGHVGAGELVENDGVGFDTEAGANNLIRFARETIGFASQASVVGIGSVTNIIIINIIVVVSTTTD